MKALTLADRESLSGFPRLYSKFAQNAGKGILKSNDMFKVDFFKRSVTYFISTISLIIVVNLCS